MPSNINDLECGPTGRENCGSMSAPVIEKGIPIPLRERGGGRPWGWPFREMEIGDSFATPFKDGETSTRALRRVDYIYAGRRLGRKYTGRTLVENGVRVVRVWRLT